MIAIVFAVGFTALLMSAAGALAAGRVALVMAAEEYQKLEKSGVGLKRGSEIADALKARGFDVILSSNPSNATARAHLRDFSLKTEGADLALAILIGHGTAWGGQSFFLTTNTEIGRATDLLSRAVSVTNIAHIVGRAANGGVFFFMTTPDFSTPIEGLDARPQFNAEIGKNVFAVFSSSAKVPISRIDAVSEQAAEALTGLLQRPSPTLKEAVGAASSGNLGMIVGAVGDINLAKPTAAEVAATSAQPPEGAEKAAEPDGRLEAERQARELAERRARAEQARAEQAQIEIQKAQADILRAQADAKKAQADAERAQAEAEKARQEAKRIEAQALLARAQAEALKPANLGPPIDESQLGQRQRLLIQERLRAMGLYTGPIDAIMGPLTREAIMGFQKSRGAPVTGYLTADQYDVLLSRAEQ